MNTTLLLNQAGKEVERAKTQAAVDAKADQLAHELAPGGESQFETRAEAVQDGQEIGQKG